MWIGALLLCGAAAVAVAAAILIDRRRTPMLPADRAMCWVCGRLVPFATLTTRGCQVCAAQPRPPRACVDCGAGLPATHRWTRCERCMGARVAQILAQRQAGPDDAAIGRLLDGREWNEVPA